jgi:hypothetical protein
MLVLTEGVVPYLTDADVAALADDLRRTEKVRFWITDYFSSEVIAKLCRRSVSIRAQGLVRFLRRAWLEGERGPLHLRAARQAHSSAALVEALGECGGRLHLSLAPRADETLRRLCALGAKVR